MIAMRRISKNTPTFSITSRTSALLALYLLCISLNIVILSDYACVFPIENHEYAKQHTAEVSEVCYAAHHSLGAAHQFKHAIAYHHPLCLDGEWEWNDKHLQVGERHAECQQQAKHGTGSTHSKVA